MSETNENLIYELEKEVETLTDKEVRDIRLVLLGIKNKKANNDKSKSVN